MKTKHFFAGWLVLVGCVSWLAGCTVDEDESSDGSSGWGPETPVEDESEGDENEQSAGVATDDELKPRPFPNCGILPCPTGTTCTFDALDEPSCMSPPGATCATVDCGEYFHCEMTARGALCVPGGSDS